MDPHDAHRHSADERGWTAAVQQILDAMPGNHALLLPIRDEAGELADFWIAAASPETLDVFGRRGAATIGTRIRGDYGQAVHGPVWQAFREVLADGRPRQVGPFPFERPDTGLPPARFTIWLRRVGDGLLDSWTREDDYSRLEERVAQTERLANLGWSEQDLVSGTTRWSDQLYRIYERDPEAGPMSAEESEAVTLREDRPVRRQAAERLSSGQSVDVTYRIKINGGLKYVRVIADTVRDVQGRPLRTYGIVQDITGREANRSKLARVEQLLYEHQQQLAAENRLVAELQQIILPIPGVPIDLPGLRVAIRYLPAEQANRIGGDWYHAGTAHDGSVIIAVGDVAGHGIRAAAAMAQLRQAFATLVTTATADPAELLSYLNRLMLADGDLATLASAVVARYEQESGNLIWAQAGHPAPLHSRRGVTQELDRPSGPMLGAVDDAVYGSASFTIQPEDLLVFYTDGLIERRGHSLEEGLRPVIATLDRLGAARSPHPLTDLLGQLHRANPEDDTCILALRQVVETEKSNSVAVEDPVDSVARVIRLSP